jgi:ferredoxin-NADP reductase
MGFRMAHRVYRCQIQSIKWVGLEATGMTAILRFKPQVEFDYEPGQFVSLQVPDKHDPKNMLWRAYSLSLPAEMAKKHGYELCIKKMTGGNAAAFLDRVKPGDWVNVRAAYGEFTMRTKAGRGVCFIGTGTGVAPLRSIALSKKFNETDLLFGIAILGYRTFEEIPYAGDFERVGLATTYAVSDGTAKLDFPFYNGRVTDVLKRLKTDFPWRETDYYLCGNGFMIRDVNQMLKTSHGVHDDAIIAEAFLPASKQSEAA